MKRPYKRRAIKTPIIDGVRFLTIIQLAEKTGYSRRHLYRLAQQGTISGVRKGVKYFFHPDTLAVSETHNAPDIEAESCDEDEEDFCIGL